jgi:hypothetical protein
MRYENEEVGMVFETLLHAVSPPYRIILQNNQSDILGNIDTSNEVSKNVTTVPEDDGGGDFPQGDDDLLPFDDDDGGAAAPPLPDDSSLHEAGIADITNSRNHSNSTLNIGFGDSPVQPDDEATTTKRKIQSARKAKKKRRKIITDSSELSSAHIRQMLDDTSPTMMLESEREPPKPKYSIEERFYFPCMDDDLLPDSVLAVWRNNMSMAMGKSVEYEMQSDDADEAAVEVPREADAKDAEVPQADANDDSFPVDDDEQQPPDDEGIPFDNEELPPMDGAMEENRTLPLGFVLFDVMAYILLQSFRPTMTAVSSPSAPRTICKMTLKLTNLLAQRNGTRTPSRSLKFSSTT